VYIAAKLEIITRHDLQIPYLFIYALQLYSIRRNYLQISYFTYYTHYLFWTLTVFAFLVISSYIETAGSVCINYKKS
jgi:hypothetical protein